MGSGVSWKIWICHTGMDMIGVMAELYWWCLLYSVIISFYCVFTLLNFCGRSLQTSPQKKAILFSFICV